MNYLHSQFSAYAGQKLYLQVWRPDGPAVASLIIVHGLSEHSGRYMNLVNGLVPEGITVYAYDQRGHGHSATHRVAHVGAWKEYREDLRALVERVSRQEPETPLFLFGHSMGGLVSAEYALHYPHGLHGVILSAPPLGEIGVSPLLRLLGRLVARVRPGQVFSSGLDLNGISRDPDVVAAYNQDPMIHGRVTAGWSVEFFRALAWTREHAAEFSPPLLILHGDADRLVPIEGSRRFFEKIRQPDKRYIRYPGGYHESLNDLQHAQVIADVKRWVKEHIQAGLSLSCPKRIPG